MHFAVHAIACAKPETSECSKTGLSFLCMCDILETLNMFSLFIVIGYYLIKKGDTRNASQCPKH